MAKKLVLHVGTPKTGTSTIQGFMRTNRALLAKRSVAYPVRAFNKRSVSNARNGHPIFYKALQLAGYTDELSASLTAYAEEGFRMLQEQAAGPCATTVLSDESFWRLAACYPGALEALRSLGEQAGFGEFQIVVYLRRQDLFLESTWNQRVKNGTSYVTTYDEFRTGEFATKVTDYNSVLGCFEQAFGRENITARIYDRSLLVAGDSAADFLSLLGLDAAQFKPLKREINDSIKGNSWVELKRIANHAPAYAKSGNFMRGAFKSLSVAVPEQQPGALMSPEERRAYLAAFEEGNRAVAQRYFQRDELFGPQKVDEQPKWEPSSLEMSRDALLLAVEGLAEANARVAELEERVRQLEGHAQQPAGSSLNGLAVKIKRHLSR